ncbi:hypothetical protein [Budvicia diplopodorum]|uniref:hypothetical protein n=1 Tax=Budvicia diplopodorum TaxID=1119056 RepID=UPI001358F992|nr:hypothetical protein [Budvicia diplopodorum]
MKLSVLQRLPQFYHWYTGPAGTKVELTVLPDVFNEQNERDSLIGLKLLSYPGPRSWQVMHNISQYLNGINIENSVIDIDGEPCLFVNSHDDAIVLCCLKNLGIAIAEYTPAKPSDRPV